MGEPLASLLCATVESWVWFGVELERCSLQQQHKGPALLVAHMGVTVSAHVGECPLHLSSLFELLLPSKGQQSQL